MKKFSIKELNESTEPLAVLYFNMISIRKVKRRIINEKNPNKILGYITKKTAEKIDRKKIKRFQYISENIFLQLV